MTGGTDNEGGRCEGLASERLPMFRWTRRIVGAWMKITVTTVVPRVFGINRDVFVDLYLVLMIPVLGAILALSSHWAGTVLASWMIVDVCFVTLHDLVRDKPIRGQRRWLLATLPTLAHAVLCFAILFLWWGDRFIPAIETPLQALYVSVQTFSTLGYGDHMPSAGEPIGMIIVMAEMSLFLLLVIIRVPMAVSLLKMHDDEERERITERTGEAAERQANPDSPATSASVR